MDKYTTLYPSSASGIACNGFVISNNYLTSNIEKLQAVVEAAEKYVSIKKGAKSATIWDDLAAAEEGLFLALANVQPKTIQQLQEERNSAADELAHYMIHGMSSSDSLEKYEVAKAVHEAALAKQTGE